MKVYLGWVLVLLLVVMFTPSPTVVYEAVYVDNIIVVSRNDATIMKERVVFTSFWPSDATGSGTITHSGLAISDFQLNENNWYTYHGMVVVATATTQCLESSKGSCGKYMEPLDTHHYFDLFSIIQIIVDGKTYDAIVLDSCGACFWDEEYQRVDIFVKDKNASVGKVKGAILY